MKTLITQKISNHLVFTDVKRTLHIVGMNINTDAGQVQFFYRITLEKDGTDVTKNFTDKTPVWIVDNSYKVALRDKKMRQIPNPEYKEEKDEEGNVTNESEKHLTMPAFDYLYDLIFNKQIPITPTLKAYITIDDANGRFNF